MARRKAAKRDQKNASNANGANLGFESTLWAAADKLRGHMDAAVYKHVVLGLIFLKYISDAFQEKYDALRTAQETDYTDPEDRDEYTAANIFWVPKKARWTLTDLLDSGVNPDDVQDLAGHADLRTTRLCDRRKREVTRNIVERIPI